ncbi:hypothetical protein ACJRO7_033996 [Eucalyptus globulus]|uniref:Exportin-5 C-terminal domain-containing protein n=1 Tax=Eucalyptus globulus TaxID=34317 RepID=A0ABD3J5A2_EUCGL
MLMRLAFSVMNDSANHDVTEELTTTALLRLRSQIITKMQSLIENHRIRVFDPFQRRPKGVPNTQIKGVTEKRKRKESSCVSGTLHEDLALMESMPLALENVVNTIFDGLGESGGGNSEVQLTLCTIFEGLLQQLLALKWGEPVLVEVLGRYLDDPLAISARYARLHVYSSFIRIAKVADKSILPHMNGIADTMAYLQREGCLLRGEHNILGEAFLLFIVFVMQLLRAIHSLWSPPVFYMLPSELKAAMTISNVEQTGLLGEGVPKSSKSTLNSADGSQTDLSKEGNTEANENDIWNWLKGVRDSGYNVLGLSTTVGDAFFKCSDIHSVAVALMENIQSMEFRHIRLLVHLVVLETLLQPLFIHSQQALGSSWSSLLHEGRVKVLNTTGMVASSDLKVEVMEEKLLRDLIREICALLSTIASPALNTGLPSLEQSGHASRIDTSSLQELDVYSQSSMVSQLVISTVTFRFSGDPASEKKTLPQFHDPTQDEGVTLDLSGCLTNEAEKKLEEVASFSAYCGSALVRIGMRSAWSF